MSVQVRNLQAIRDFRARLMKFQEELDGALQAIHMETRRACEWIDDDRPRYWTNQTRRAFDLVAATRTALNTCQMRTVAGHRSSCIEEKAAYAAAKRRLEFTQSQNDLVRRWSQRLRHEVDEFRGRTTGLQRLVETDLPAALALLQRTIAVLEDYSESAPASERTSVQGDQT